MAKKDELIRLQPSLLREVRELAKEEDASVTEFINVVVAEKVGALQRARFFAERASWADIPGAIELLRRLGAGKPPLPGDVARRLNRIAEDCAALPDVDPRSPDEIIGYDEDGVPR